MDSISFHYEQHAALVLGTDLLLEPTTGSVTFVPFFGSSLAANPHLHMMFLDGVFARAKNGIKFCEHRGLSQESMFDVLEMIYLRLAKLFAKKGYVDASGEASVPDDFDSDVPMPFRTNCDILNCIYGANFSEEGQCAPLIHARLK